ncbi:MAG: glycosyltransferase [Dokdonella sp.]
MNAEPPLVSILIRSMDRPTLDRALDSAAAQTWPNLEIVVAAACGSAHRALPETYKGRALRLVYPDPDRRLPRPEAANACLDAAHGEWLNFLDDDDELFPEHVQTLLETPRAANVRLLYSSARIIDAEGKFRGYSGRDGFHMQLYNQNRSQPVATIFHRSLVDEGARFDSSYPVMEDQDFFINCASRTPFQWVQASTCIWNGYIGDSGCGLGSNHDDSLTAPTYKRLREKWKWLFDRWKQEPEALFYLGQHHLKEGDISIAVTCFERLLADLPNDLNALNLGGMAHFHSGNSARALELLTRADALKPQHPAISANLALVRDRIAAASTS